jgi:predicted ATPase
MRGFKPEKRYRHLDRTGRALAETVFRLKSAAPERWARVTEYLRRINPSVLEVDAVVVDANYNLRFKLEGGRGLHEEFSSQNISDGTLRALAVLVALFQKNDRYPFDSIMEGSQFAQVVVTSHSPDLLDRNDIPEDAIKAVAMCEGRTIIGPVDKPGRSALKDRLYTVGELMRMDQLRPEGAVECSDDR